MSKDLTKNWKQTKDKAEERISAIRKKWKVSMKNKWSTSANNQLRWRKTLNIWFKPMIIWRARERKRYDSFLQIYYFIIGQTKI